MNDKVSVVIPVFNSAQFLESSIQSVIDQSWENLEVIAVNDGSTDESLDILQQFSDQITVINQSNSGLANALNSGIRKISGNYFKWFSPDDILRNDAIEKLVSKANSSQNTIFYSNWDIIDEKNNVLRTFHEHNFNNLSIFDYNVRLLDGQQINVNTSLIPVSLFEKGCIFQDLDDPVAIDYDFFLRAGIIHKYKFHLISDNLLKYRIHPNQLSHKNIVKTLEDTKLISEQILSELSLDEKKRYLDALETFQNSRNLKEKSMQMGLKITSKLPDWASDKILTFYLNKIRRNR